MKKHAWEGSWIRKLRSLGRRKRELPRRGCVCCPQTPANPAQDLLTSHFEECFSIVWRSARELRKGRLNCLKMKPRAPQNEAKMGPGGLPKGLLADLGRPGPRLGPFWCAPGCSWAPLGALLAPFRAVLGPSWGLLGRSWDLLSRSWGSCWPPGELFLELFGSPFLNALARKRKP